MSRDLYDVDQFIDERLADYERRAELERAGTLGAAIEYELIEGGPLKLYLEARREEAADAIKELITADPRDAVAIAQAQATVHEYVKAAQWIAGRMEAADQAEQTIKREYDRHDQDERYVD